MVSFAEIGALPLVRVALLLPMMTAVMIVVLKAAREIARVAGERTSGANDERTNEPHAAEKVRQYIQWGERSVWGRKDLVGRLRVTLRRLYRGTPPTEDEIAYDEARLESLVRVPAFERRRHGTHPLDRELLALTKLWEARMNRRPPGGQ